MKSLSNIERDGGRFRRLSTAALLAGASPLGMAPERKDESGTTEAVAKAVEEFGDLVKERLDAADKRMDAIDAKAGRLALEGAPEESTAGAIGRRRKALPDATAEHKALAALIRTGDDAELKSMSVASDPDGGYLVTPAMSERMTTKLFDATPMRRICRVEAIGAHDAFEEPDDYDEAGAEWVGESAARPETDSPELGMIRTPLHEIYALVKVTQKLIDTTGFDLGAWVEGKIADRFARKEGSAFVVGNGMLKPKGLLAYDAVVTTDATRPRGQLQYVKSGDASAFPADDPADKLKALMWALRAPYRQGAVWLLNSNTASVIDQWKDGQGNYIWRTGMTAGAASSLLGYPVEFDENMPDIAADAFPIAFGNFQLGYVIVDHQGTKYLRDPYSSKPHVQFYAYRRVGGGLADSEAIKLLKIEV